MESNILVLINSIQLGLDMSAIAQKQKIEV